MRHTTFKEVTIADEGSLSDAADILGHRVVAVLITGAGTWQAAGLTFQIDPNGEGTYYNVYTDDETANEYNPGADKSRLIFLKGSVNGLPGGGLIGAGIKVRSGTSGSAVSQTDGPFTVTLLLEPMI